MKNAVTPSVAIVDDDHLYRKLVRYLLLKGKYKLAFEAQNGKECLQLMEESNTLPDLIIMDLKMPVMDGYQTAIEIKRRWPQVPVLFHTSVNTTEEQAKIQAAGPEHFLLKGDKSLSLVEMMGRILEGVGSRVNEMGL